MISFKASCFSVYSPRRARAGPADSSSLRARRNSATWLTTSSSCCLARRIRRIASRRFGRETLRTTSSSTTATARSQTPLTALGWSFPSASWICVRPTTTDKTTTLRMMTTMMRIPNKCLLCVAMFRLSSTDPPLPVPLSCTNPSLLVSLY